MNILEIYKKYQIMPQLAEHQLTVAGVADFICEHFTPLPLHQSSNFGAGQANPPREGEGIMQIDRRDVVAACLLHDMGNIIKFDLSLTGQLHPGMFKDSEMRFWQQVKAGYIKKYGMDEHRASIAISREVGAGERVAELVDSIGFNTGKINAESKDFNRKICAYSDMRVWPKGVTFLEQRLADLRARYGNKFQQMGGNEARRLEFENGLREIERQIFEHCDIKPEDITEAVVAERREKLKSFEIYPYTK